MRPHRASMQCLWAQTLCCFGPFTRPSSNLRSRFQYCILLQGFHVVSLDMDVALFRDPFDPAANPLAGTDMFFSLDGFSMTQSSGVIANIGFMGLRSTPQV